MDKTTPDKNDSKVAPSANGVCLRDHVRCCVQTYFEHMDGYIPANLYDTVMTQCELPLIQVVMKRSGGNISLAARMLGINRSTLRRKLQQHGLE